MPISFEDFVKNSGGSVNNVNVLDKNNTFNPNTQPVIEPNYLQRVGGAYKNAAQDITNAVTDKSGALSGAINEANTAKTPVDALKGVANTAAEETRVGLRTAGAVAGATFAPITEIPAIKNFVGAVASQILKIPGVEHIVQNASQLAEQNPTLAKDIQNIVDIVSLAGAGKVDKADIAKNAETIVNKTSEVGKNVASTTGKALKSAGEASYGITVPPQESTARALLNYDAQQPNLFGRIKNFLTNNEIGDKPITESNTAARKGLIGTEYQIGVQSKKISNSLFKDVIEPKLSSPENSLNMKDFLKKIESNILNETEGVRQDQLLKAYDVFSKPYKNLGDITGLQLQKFKEDWAKFLPEATYKGKPIASALKEIQDIAASEARPILYKFVGNEGKQAYIDYGNLQSIIDAGIKSTTGDLAKKSLGRDIWQTVMNKAVTPVVTTAGKVLYRTGEGLEFIGKKGAKKVSDIINK